MKQILCSLLLYLSCILVSNAQSNKYLKLIEKNDFVKAEKQLSKSYTKASDDIELNHAYAVLFNSKKYNAYTPYTAYKYILVSIKEFDKLSDVEKEKYIKKGYTNDHLFAVRENCLDLAYKDCKDANTVDCFKNYISYFSDAEIWQSKAQRAIYQISFDEAEKLNSTESYQNS